jgi:predicted nucleic acid-binding protein
LLPPPPRRIAPALRLLPFAAAAAARYPQIVLARRQAGNPIEKFDALIAAAALAAGAGIATRDLGRFAGCGLTVIDPWTASYQRDTGMARAEDPPPRTHHPIASL